MGKQMNPLAGDGTLTYSGEGSTTTSFSIPARMIMHQNLLFDRNEIKWYSHFNRYGCIDPYNHDQVLKEFLFFTKPDLYIFDGSTLADATLNPSLSIIPFFVDAAKRHPNALGQLQYGIKDEMGNTSPYMALLSNAVTSKLDLPTIQSEFNQSTPNIYGVTIDYRSHSMKSDNSYDFTLSFTDTAYLEIYTMVKAYDEYMRLQKLGDIEYNDIYKEYIIDKIIPEQFSIYKFLIGTDGETILYYAKATGVFFTDVPRSDLSDPGNDGFKYSISFHANFVEDSNPSILSEFNRISPMYESIKSAKSNRQSINYVDVYNGEGVNNSWARYPYIETVDEFGDKRVARRSVHKDYRLKWLDPDNPSEDNAYASGINTSTVGMYNPNYYGNTIINSGSGKAGSYINGSFVPYSNNIYTS